MTHCRSKSNRKSRKEVKKETREHKEKTVGGVESTLKERKKGAIGSGRK